MIDGGLNSLHDSWNSIQYTATSGGAPLQLPALATYIHNIKPHAADPEKTFSLMGFFHSARRNQLLNTTTTAMTAIKMHHTEKGDRKVKPERDIQAVLQKEEDFQRLETLAIADAVAEEVKEKEAQDERETSSAVNLELCSTSEMMEVSSEYYEGDKHDMAQSHMQINDASINASVEVKAKEFDLDYEGTSAEFNLPDIDFGNTTDSFRVEDLLGMEPVHVNQLDPRRGAPKRQICPHFNIVVSHGYIRTHVCYEDGFFRYAKKQKTPPAQQASQQGTWTERVLKRIRPRLKLICVHRDRGNVYGGLKQRTAESLLLDLAGDTGTGSALGSAGQNAQAVSMPGGYHHGYPTYTHPDSTKQQLVQDFWNMTCRCSAQPCSCGLENSCQKLVTEDAKGQTISCHSPFGIMWH
ncbi:TPA: hypothetical protein ACH3X1_016407 [Trebouxia sp. C0004]